jgi:hypothetical protein
MLDFILLRLYCPLKRKSITISSRCDSQSRPEIFQTSENAYPNSSFPGFYAPGNFLIMDSHFLSQNKKWHLNNLKEDCGSPTFSSQKRAADIC